MNRNIVRGLSALGFNHLAVVLSILCIAPLVAQEPNWMQKFPANSPTPRYYVAMAYDAAREQVVLYGQYPSEGSETWVWDGTEWILKSPANTPPLKMPVMAYDVAREQVILFGGDSYYNGTWVWDGANWMQKTPANSPGPLYMPAMAYDAARGQVVLFGRAGFGDNVTWVWDGTDWTLKTQANSPPIYDGSGMAYDAARREVVLFGGRGGDAPFLNDTYVWDGTSWTQKNPTHRPPVRSIHTMAYDAARGQVVLFGGWFGGTAGTLNDTWLWDGINWTEGVQAIRPPSRAAHAMAYDAAHEQLVLFGGLREEGELLNDTWILASGSTPTTGTISVSTNLPAASFTIAGPATYSGSGTSFTTSTTPAGTYTITYGAVNCFITPPSETKTLVPGGTLSFGGQYSGVATISVGVVPQSAADRATYSISPSVPGLKLTGPYPVILSGAWPQPYTVTFNPVAGLVTPPPQTAGPSASCNISFAGNYSTGAIATTSLLIVETNRDDAKFTISKTGGSTWEGSGRKYGPVVVPPGQYEVKFTEPGQGYFFPPPVKLSLQSGETGSFRGTYRKLFLVAFTGYGNAPDKSKCGEMSPDDCGVRYRKSEFADDSGRGLTLLLNKILDANEQPALSNKQQTVAGAFTFFSAGNGGQYTRPSTNSDHAEAEQWLRDSGYTTEDILAVIGHSYGGNRAYLFADQVTRKIPEGKANLLVTVDAINWDVCNIAEVGVGGVWSLCNQNPPKLFPRSAAAETSSYYQNQGLAWKVPYIMGFVPNDAEATLVKKVYHMEIDTDPGVLQSIVSKLINTVRSLDK